MPSSTPTGPVREVRFAVVMYGGVSLAIYMNGVAQELLRLVRASASSTKKLEGTERIYRRIAQRIEENGDWIPPETWTDEPLAPVQTRFVIDVVSGTSAGGINGIFLSKALARGQSLDRLAQLWIQEGAIEHLLNDKKSAYNGLRPHKEPTSLLNSQRMYGKLVDAFETMDDDVATGAPLVSDVDLFVTTTDIAGLPIALRLADGVVPEMRHRNVFHFRFSDGQNGAACNDFGRDDNPFLAFAARCTSSFPFAFEPMTLADMDVVLRNRPGRAALKPVRDDGEPWTRFFPAYLGVPDGDAGTNDPQSALAQSVSAVPFRRGRDLNLAHRPFADGGYLDNKPFEYAIGVLASRRSDIPVDRKLLYLEPSPEHPELVSAKDARPDAIENVRAALSLARSETIRGDLERVRGRNRIVDRVDRILRGIDDDLALGNTAGNLEAPGYSPSQDYAATDLDTMIDLYGSAYGGYHRLKVSALTDEIAEYVARAAGFDETSDEFEAIRYLVGAWRGGRYQPRKRDMQAPGMHTENAFLLRFDLNYRIRRASFVLGRIDRLLSGGKQAEEMVARRHITVDRNAVTSEACMGRLRELRSVLAPALNKMREQRFTLLARDRAVNPIGEEVANLGISGTYIRKVLTPPTADRRREVAKGLLDDDDLRQRVDAAAMKLASIIEAVTRGAAGECTTVLPPPPIAAPDSSDGAAVATALVRAYYWDYESYDQLIFPAYFSTDVGEEVGIVDVLRVSPEDAVRLIDERSPAESRRKLAGTKLGHFGAFLDQRWRWNDIMWGRLDGAERLIATLLPGNAPEHQQARDALIAEAHEIILEEELAKKEAEPFDWATTAERGDIVALLRLDPKDPLLDTERARLRGRVREAFMEHYCFAPQPDTELSLSAAARATRVVGGMLQRMADEYAYARKPGVWLARLGTISWGLVEVAVPHRLQAFAFRYWLKLAYAFEVVLAIIGTLIGNQAIRSFGVGALGITLAIHLVVMLLGDLFAKRSTWLHRLATVMMIALAITLQVGALVLLSARLRGDMLAEVRAQAAPVRFLVSAFLLGAGLVGALAGAIYLDARRRATRAAARKLEAVRALIGKGAAAANRNGGNQASAAAASSEPGFDQRQGPHSPQRYDRRSSPMPAQQPVSVESNGRLFGWLKRRRT